ncbi:uncharacterized protein LOC128467501 [Spea bombifrons]|uniref:uncharacterized protein LOC128467501 n=1 Tax=Spea bombifrons TaxID=233779 RepID=UPI00234BAC46|nr:uncharacterized protein LOC128467501 [Spea bombifrons]
MDRRSLPLLFVLTAFGSTYSLNSVQVISGVFMTPELDVDYHNATTTCNKYENSTLASLEQVTNALKHGYELCKWAWIKEQKMVMLRLTPFEGCGNFSLGILTKEDLNRASSYTFCFTKPGALSWVYDAFSGNLGSSYEDAGQTCALKGDIIATQEQIESTPTRQVTANRISWYNLGLGFFDINNNFIVSPPVRTQSQGGAFCYNPNLKDNIIQVNDTLWKRITIACVLGSIFVILLIAGIFMKGNQFICCMKDRRTVNVDGLADVSPPAPKWNATGIYKPMTQRKDSKYISDVAIEGRPPAIRPEMNVYRSHIYSNRGYSNTGDE